MIIAILFIIILVMGVVLLPLAWWSGNCDVRLAFIFWAFALSFLYMFDAETIIYSIRNWISFWASLPWTGSVVLERAFGVNHQREQEQGYANAQTAVISNEHR